MSAHDESHFGPESYALSQNMFQNTDKRGLMEKEALAGEIWEGETTKELKESSACRHPGIWLVICATSRCPFLEPQTLVPSTCPQVT